MLGEAVMSGVWMLLSIASSRRASAAFGVSLGANRPSQAPNSKPGKLPLKVGTSGRALGAALAGHGEGLHLSALDVARGGAREVEEHGDAARDEVRAHGAASVGT